MRFRSAGIEFIDEKGCGPGVRCARGSDRRSKCRQAKHELHGSRRTPKKPKAPNNPRAPKAVDIFVGSRIRLWRMRREMTQEQLGKFLKVAYQQIQKYEKGVNRIAAARLNDFANALHVPVSEFFAGSKDAEHKSFASPSAAFDR